MTDNDSASKCNVGIFLSYVVGVPSVGNYLALSSKVGNSITSKMSNS